LPFDIFTEVFIVNIPHHNPDPPIRLLAAFQQAFPNESPDWITRAPGRDVWLAASPAPSDHFTVFSPDQGGQTTFSMRSAKLKQTVYQRMLPRWAYYPAGVMLVLYNLGHELNGRHIAVISEEPDGPAYDYGIGIAFTAYWHEVLDMPFTIDSLIEVVDKARRDYVEAS
jgi:galactokinase